MKDAYYFSHDSNAKDDPKCTFLIEQLGLEGYGIFWVLLETLRDQPEYRYPLALIPSIARKYNTTPDKVKAVVGNYGLFQVCDSEFFFSQSLVNRMDKWEISRNKRIEAGKRSGEVRRTISYKSEDTNIARTMLEHSSNNAELYKGKERKVEEKKEEVNTVSKKQVFTKPTQIEISEYLVTEKNFDDFYAQGFASKFFHYYESNGWKVGKNPMKSWRSAVSLWVSKESDNKPKNGLRNDSGKSLIEKHMEVNKILKQKYANESANNL